MGDPEVVSAVTVRFTVQPAEAIRARRVLHARLWRAVAVYPVVLLVMSLAIIPLIGWPSAAVAVIPMWIMALLVIALAYLDPSIWAWIIRRHYPEPFRDETVITVDAAGIHTTQGTTSVDSTWAGLSDWVEDREFIGLRRGRMLVAVVPKRAFANEAERDAFVAVLRAHLPPRIAPGVK